MPDEAITNFLQKEGAIRLIYSIQIKERAYEIIASSAGRSQLGVVQQHAL